MTTEDYIWSLEQAQAWVSERPRRIVDWGIRAGEPEGRDIVLGLGGKAWAIQYCAIGDPQIDPSTMREVRAMIIEPVVIIEPVDEIGTTSVEEEGILFTNYKCYTCNDFIEPLQIVDHLINHAKEWKHIYYRDLSGWVWRINPRILRSVEQYLR